MDNPIVHIDGRPFDGWKSLKIERRLDSAAAKVTIETKPHEIRATGQKVPWRMKPGASFFVKTSYGPDRRRGARVHTFNSDAMAEGYVDAVQTEIDSQSRSLTIVGRDGTSALVDCSAPWQPGEFRDFTLAELVGAMVVPFGVRTRFWAGSEPFNRKLPLFRIEAGETAWSAIERACRLFGVLAYGDESGDLEIARPGQVRARDVLREGKNFIAGSALYSHADRYSEYQVVGQSGGDDESWGETVAHVRGFATDVGVKRHRPLTVVAEGSVTAQGAQTRAEWEASVRASRGSRVSLILPTWVDSENLLWRINEKVAVVAESLGVSEVMLIVGTTHTVERDQPPFVTLELGREDAFKPQPQVDPSKDPFADVREDGW